MLYKLKRPISKFIMRYLESRARRKLQMHTDVWKYLGGVVSASTGCSYNDYWVMYSYVLNEKPKEILEFGSGISTAVLAYAMKRNGFGRLTSLEESEEYADETKRAFPQHLLNDGQISVEIIHSPSIEKRHGLFAGRGYSKIPERQYEFIFVDGPYYERETSFDVDLLHIVGKSDIPVTAMVDSRAGSCVVYNLFLKNKFSFDYFQNIGWLSNATRKDLSTFHTVITRELADHSIKRALLL